MTRARKANQEELARRYIFDSGSPPITFSELSAETGLSRPYLVEMGVRGAGTSMPGKSWTEQRKEYRLTVGEKVLNALADEWADTQVLLQKRMLETAVKMLDQFDRELADGKIALSARDYPMILNSIRTMLGDVAAGSQRDEPKLINPDDVPIDPKKLAEALPMLKQLVEGGGNGTGAAEPRVAGDDAAADAAGSLKN